MAKTLQEWSRQAAGLGRRFDEIERRAVSATAKHVRKTVLASMAVAVGPDLRMSRVGKRGARIGVRSQALGKDRVVLQATGPVPLIERPIKAHQIPKRRTRGRRRLPVIPGVGPRSTINHPGTKGKKPWAKGVAAAAPAIPVIHQREVRQGIREAFRL